MDYFIDALKKSTEKVYDDFIATKSIWHNASSGMIREKIIKNILKPYMPDSVGISGGLCYDSNGKQSKQLDLILYDKLYSYRLPFDDDFIVFPCESVYGNIEIKTNLNRDTLQESIDNISSLKSLYREDATEFNLTPQVEIALSNQTTGSKKNHYFGVVFAYNSVSIETLMKDIQKSNKPSINLYMPDLFVLLDKNTLITRYNKSDGAIQLCGSSEGYIPIKTEKDTFAYLIMYLLTIVHFTRLKAMNPGRKFGLDIINEKVPDIKHYTPFV